MRLLLIFFLWQISNISYATYNDGKVDPKRATAAEMQRLPELCQLRFKWGPDGKQFSKWRNILGPEYIHIHHYCVGLVDLMRLNKHKPHWEGRLRTAKGNFNYVLARVQNPKFIMLPDLYYRLAIVAKEEGNSSEAISFANKSIQAKNNYLNPYLLLSNVYIKSGKKNEAKKTLLKAQHYHPNSKTIKRRLKEIK